MSARSLGSLTLGLLLSAGLAACSSSATSSTGSAQSVAPTSIAAAPTGPTTQLAEYTIQHDQWSNLGYRWSWAGTPVVRPGTGIIELDVYPDRVVALTSDTTVSVLRASTGSTIWSTEIDRPQTRVLGVTRDDDRLLITTETQLHEVELDTGNLINRFNFEKLANTVPVLTANLAIVGTVDGELLAMDRNYGLTDWRYGIGDTIKANPVLMNPETITAITQSGEVATIDLAGPSARVMDRISGGLDNNPVSDNYYFVVAGLDRSVYCFVEGTRIWRHRTSEKLRVQPVIYQEYVFFGSPKLGVVCLEAGTGEKLWEQPALSNGWVVGVRDGELLVWNGLTLAAVDPENGDIIAAEDLPGIAGIRTDAFVDGNLYALAGNETVLKFETR